MTTLATAQAIGGLGTPELIILAVLVVGPVVVIVGLVLLVIRLTRRR